MSSVDHHNDSSYQGLGHSTTWLSEISVIIIIGASPKVGKTS